MLVSSNPCHLLCDNQTFFFLNSNCYRCMFPPWFFLFSLLSRPYLLFIGASEVTLNPDEMWRTFRNLSLSYRASERQAPNNLQLALRFSRALEIHQQQGTHPSSWGLEERLKAVCKDFQENCGLTQKHRIDDDKFKGLVNLISGTTSATRAVIAEHLNHAKWKSAPSRPSNAARGGQLAQHRSCSNVP